MKKISLALFMTLAAYHLYSQQQNVGLGTSSPHLSSILDITSTSRGVLIPRMNFIQKNSITSPATGLMVYQTNTTSLAPEGFYYYDGSQWKRFAKSDDITGGWTVSGTNQYSSVTGNVGIGTSTPTSKLHIVGSTLMDGSTFAIDHSSGILQFRNNGVNKSYVQLSEGSLRLGTNTGNSGGGVLFRLDGTVRMVIDSLGDVGINTTSPLAKLHVRSSSGLDPLAIHATAVSDNPAIQWYNALSGGAPGVKKVFIGLNDGEDLRLGTNSGNTTGEIIFRLNGNDRIWVNEDGEMGLGTEYPAAKLTIHEGQDADYDPAVGNGFIMLGDLLDINLMLDNNEIMARDFNMPATLHVQADGGLLKIGGGTTATGTKVQITGGEGASLSGQGFVVLGEPSASNMTLDVNEIQARSNGNAATMYVQRSGGNFDIGGNTIIGGHTTINNSGEALRLNGINSNIGFYYNNAFKSFIAQGSSNLTVGVNNGKIHLDGTQIAIGTINTEPNMDQYKLTVNGKVICTEVKVALFSNWPDYVFHQNYNLKPLHELKSFIETNHHLPNIPKAAEVEKEGLELGEMNRKLLEKIEELTLYVIDLQEQINEMKQNKQ